MLTNEATSTEFTARLPRGPTGIISVPECLSTIHESRAISSVGLLVSL